MRAPSLQEIIQDLCARPGGAVNSYRLTSPQKGTVSLVVYHEKLREVWDGPLLISIRPRQTRETVLTLPLSEPDWPERVEATEKIVKALIQEFRPEPERSQVWWDWNPRKSIEGSLVIA